MYVCLRPCIARATLTHETIVRLSIIASRTVDRSEVTGIWLTVKKQPRKSTFLSFFPHILPFLLSQVFKDGLRRTIMGGNGKRKKNVRYFSRAELKQLFTLFPPAVCRVRFVERASLVTLRLSFLDRLGCWVTFGFWWDAFLWLLMCWSLIELINRRPTAVV